MRRTWWFARRAGVAAVLCALCAGAIARIPASGPSSGPALRTLDVNAAPAEELELLPGVGPSVASAIVADRADRGPFRSVDDLDRVRGIGPGLLAKVRPHVRAGAAPAGSAYAAR
jgi:competence protein ComEA